MHAARFRMAATAVLGCLWLATGITASPAALIIEGPIEGRPGELVTLSIGLDAALAADSAYLGGQACIAALLRSRRAGIRPPRPEESVAGNRPATATA